MKPRSNVATLMIGLFALGALAFAGGIVVVGSVGRAHPSQAFHLRERFNFATLGEMVATTPLIVEATVKGAARGRTVGDPEGPVTFVEVTIKVNDLLKGGSTGVSKSESLVVEFVATPDPRITGVLGFPPYDPGKPWWQPGSKGLFFLRSEGASGRFQLINSQGLLPFDQTGKVFSMRSEDSVGAVMVGLERSAAVAKINEFSRP